MYYLVVATTAAATTAFFVLTFTFFFSTTTPAITLDGASYALLTFSAAGWADKSTSVINTLTITANAGFELSGDNVIAELEKMVWNEYTVLIKVNTSDDLQLTFCCPLKGRSA